MKKGPLITQGYERRIYKHPTNPNLVIAEFILHDQTPEYRKAQYYIARLLHLLFPNNIPNVHLLDTRDDQMVHDRVDLSQDHTHRIIMDWKMDLHSPHYREGAEACRTVKGNTEFTRLTTGFRSLGLTGDSHSSNFPTDARGFMQYVDTFIPWDIFENTRTAYPNFDRDKIRAAINENLAPEAQTTALRYLERLCELFETEVRNTLGTMPTVEKQASD